MLLILFTRPLELDRSAGKRLGNLDHLMHVVGRAAATKPAPQNGFVDLALFDRQAGSL